MVESSHVTKGVELFCGKVGSREILIQARRYKSGDALQVVF